MFYFLKECFYEEAWSVGTDQGGFILPEGFHFLIFLLDPDPITAGALLRDHERP